MNEINVRIVDYEKGARLKLATFLKEVKGISSIKEAENGIDAVKKITNNSFDLVFLDIQMPGMTGFEVIETIGTDKMPAIIFVTAYDQYAVNAFEVQALDYLLKPYDFDRFKTSFNRAIDRINSRQSENIAVTKLIELIKKDKKFLSRIMVKEGQSYIFIKTSDLIYLKADEKYIELHTLNNKHLIRETMNKIEQSLDPSVFVRIHRSYIVNIDFIKEIQPWSHGDGIIILKNRTELSLSRRYKDKLLEIMN